MLIALIDDGINTSIINPSKVVYDLDVREDGVIEKRREEENISSNHGTICAQIILKYAPDAELCSLRIFFNNELKANCVQLVSALEWCRDENIPIINMSLGTGSIYNYNRVQKIIAKMIKQRQMIVSAHSIREDYAIPACISGVFGVYADEKMVDDEYMYPKPTTEFHFLAASSKHSFYLEYPEIITPITNSYAAPTVTAIIHNYLMNYPLFSCTVAEVHKYLKKKSDAVPLTKPDFLETAIILNLSGCQIFKKYLFFECIQEYTRIDEYEKAGNLQESLVILPPDGVIEYKYLIWKNISIDKREIVYCGVCNSNSNSTVLFWSEKNLKDYIYINENFSKEIKCPLVTIVGNQEKAMGLQCELRKVFLENHYQCIGISDFRFSYLYNLEYIHSSDISLSSIDHIREIYSADIVILSCQKTNNLQIDYEDEVRIVFNDDETYSYKMGNTNQAIIYENINIQRLYNEIICFFGTN